MTGEDAWDGYVASYHDDNPGVTEAVLVTALDDRGRDPYGWVLEALPRSGLVVDLACGSGPVLRRLGGRGVGLDRSTGELARARRDVGAAPLVRAHAGRLPVADGVAGAVTASMCLMVLTPLDRVLAAAARVRRLGGVRGATGPSRSGGAAAADAGFAEILAELGQACVGYPSSLDDAAAQLAEAGLDLATDEVGRFVRTVASDDDADLVVRSFYAPGTGEDDRRRAADRLRRRVAAGAVTVTYPIRRLVAIRG